jgi:hypothetical protein
MITNYILIISLIIFGIFLIRVAIKYDKKEYQKSRKDLDNDLISFDYSNAPPIINQYQLEDYKSIFLSGELLGLKVFQVNNSYYVLDKINHWIVDGGIEFKFKKGCFSIGFSSDFEQHTFQSTSFKELYKNKNEEELKPEETKKITSLIGKKVIDVKFKTIGFDEIVDYTMKVEKVKKLVEVILTFEDKETLQIATINYDYKENKPSKNYRYDVSNELLISLNNTTEILNMQY